MAESVAPPAARTPWGLLAVGVALGLVTGLWIAERFVPRGAAPAAVAGPETPTRAEIAGLVQALDRFSDSMQRAADRIERARDTPSEPAPPPAALVPGLPPEGVPLVRAWYLRRLRSELSDLEAVVAHPEVKLGNAASGERVAEARAEWKAEAERLLGHVDALEAVQTELALAQWLDSTGRGRGFPKPWELAELAAELKRGSK